MILPAFKKQPLFYRKEDEMKTKAQMLEYLRGHIKNINILKSYIVHSNTYFANKEEELDNIAAYFGDEKVIVRSSSCEEDNMETSNAGGFRTILNINVLNSKELGQAIEDVYASYKTDQEEEILIQPMLKDVIKSGVAFTSDITTGAPYYTINYSISSNTEAVTSGETNHLKTVIAYKYSPKIAADEDMQSVIAILKELEKCLDLHNLDVEFAVTSSKQVFILQCRPIAKGKKEVFDPIDLNIPLDGIYKKVEKLNRKHPFLLGDKTCFGVMPDWNPAEILGVRPQKLAITLYKELVTDNIWAHQRKDYGYRDLTLHPLMVSFCGIPYIDTRITFNSFIPGKLKDPLAEKLVNYYINQLAEYPAYHDKIEFEIVYSCYYLGLPNKIKRLLDYGFTENEVKRIEFSLLDLTNKIIHPDNGLYKKDIKKIEILKKNHGTIMKSDISIVDRIYWLIEECKNYGTLPFAGAARAGFIAVQFLRSFVEQGIITKTEQEQFMNSLNTVSRQLRQDRIQMENGNMSREEFLEKYGHIRPGTYDILSQRYDENFDFYFGQKEDKTQTEEVDFKFTEYQMLKIQTELEQNGLEVNSAQLMQFIREAIEGREYLKFVFTKSVSEILRLIGQLGKRLDISKEDMAHLDIRLIMQLYVDLYYDELVKVIKPNIEMNKKQFACGKVIKLPSIILKPEDIYYYQLLEEEPNYITMKSIQAEIVLEDKLSCREIAGKIVFIQAADPGYDYLFAMNIGGLVTQFGGANSHMAIRCAELGIPAVIGAGEKNFEEWKQAKVLHIDCMKKQCCRL